VVPVTVAKGAFKAAPPAAVQALAGLLVQGPGQHPVDAVYQSLQAKEAALSSLTSYLTQLPLERGAVKQAATPLQTLHTPGVKDAAGETFDALWANFGS
jgi:hypothetical protein